MIHKIVLLPKEARLRVKLIPHCNQIESRIMRGHVDVIRSIKLYDGEHKSYKMTVKEREG